MARAANNFDFDKNKKIKMIVEIQKYFRTEREEEIGDLAAELLLDFFIKKISPEFYNKGIQDAITFMTKSIEEMNGLEKY